MDFEKILAGALGIILAQYVLQMIYPKKQIDITERLIQALDTQEGVNILSSQEFKKITESDEFNDFIELLPKKTQEKIFNELGI